MSEFNYGQHVEPNEELEPLTATCIPVIENSIKGRALEGLSTWGKDI